MKKPLASSTAPKTLVDVVRQRAITDADRHAYTFLTDGQADARSITWAELDRRASLLATSICEHGAAGQPVLLALPSGLKFIESLFACWYAGAIAVPVSLPRYQRVKHRLHGIIADAGARFAIGTNETRQRLSTDTADGPATTGLNWIDTEVDPLTFPIDRRFAAGQHVAFLQYTSGSTGVPRGVVVTHANVMQNNAAIAEACGHDMTTTIGGWLPLFHDMGLVGLLLQGAYSGASTIFMAPERFLMRPNLWLQMISDYKVTSSPAPNFAYDLCVDRVTEEQKRGLDLSRWRNALNGSEPVRAATLERFATAFASCGFKRESFFPCYGLAESTLFVSGPGKKRGIVRRSAEGVELTGADQQGHVGCGRAFGDTQIAIVDPQTTRRVAKGSIGEIWVSGQSCADGYWKNPEATATTFNARIEDETGQAWLRTGDLGFIADDELFITGRLRELIIIAGRNHFPVDLERTAEAADPALAPGGAIAFSLNQNGVERLVIVAEVRREYDRPGRGETALPLDSDVVCRRIRAAVVAEHDVAPFDIVLLRSSTLPRTTSGKISHRMTHEGYVSQKLEKVTGSENAPAVG